MSKYTLGCLLGVLFMQLGLSGCAPYLPRSGNVLGTTNLTTAEADKKLANMRWQLVTIQTGHAVPSAKLKSGIAASKIQLLIGKGRLQFNGGCNTSTASIVLAEPNKLTVSQFISTKKACASDLMEADAEMSYYLARVMAYELNDKWLKLFTANNEVLSFVGTVTPDHLYGKKGVRKFIELQHNGQSIRWREAKYDKRWIRIKDNAPWQSYYPGIESFEPKPNMEYIVRIHEFTDPNTKKAVWVKDMVTMRGVLR